jgi:tetratricopeptide (TPR) repeat protein
VEVDPSRRGLLAQNLRYLADQYEKLGRLAEAVQAGDEEVQLRRVIKERVGRTCLEQAARLVGAGRVEAALAMGRTGLKFAESEPPVPALADAALTVGERLLAAGKGEPALPFGEFGLKCWRLTTTRIGPHPSRAEAHWRWGVALQDAGRHKEAVTSFRAGAKLYRELANAPEALIECLLGAARSLGHLNRDAEVEALQQEVLALTGELFTLPGGASDREGAPDHGETAAETDSIEAEPIERYMAISAMAMQLGMMGQHTEAAARFAEAAALLANDVRPEVQEERGRGLARQATSHLLAGDRAQALVVQQAAVEVLRQQVGDSAEARRALAEELTRLGHLAREAPEVAQPAYAEALDHFRALGEAGKHTSLYVETLHQTALHHLAAQRVQEAQACLSEARTLYSKCTPPPQVPLWEVVLDLGRACALADDGDSALRHLDESARLAADPQDQARIAYTRGEVLDMLERSEEAAAAMLGAVDLFWPLFEADPRRIGIMRQLVEAALELCVPPPSELLAKAAAVGIEG